MRFLEFTTLLASGQALAVLASPLKYPLNKIPLYRSPAADTAVSSWGDHVSAEIRRLHI